MAILDERRLGAASLANRIYGVLCLAFGALMAMLSAAAIALDPGPSYIVVLGHGVSLLAVLLLVCGGPAILMGLLSIAAGNRIERRQSRIFCIVVSALNTLSLPIGTVLGIATIVLLTRPTIVGAFAGDHSPTSARGDTPPAPPSPLA